MPDATYETLIKTSADDSAIKKFIAEFEELKKKVGDMQGQLEGQGQELAKFGEAGEANVGKVKDALSELSKEGQSNPLHGIHGHLRQIHAALGLMGVRGGEVGHLLHLAFSPQLLVLAGVAAGIGKIREHFAEMEKAAQEAANEAAKGLGDMKGAMEHAKTAIHEVALEYNKWLEDLTRKGPQAQTILSTQLKTLESMKVELEALAKLQGRPPEDVEKAKGKAEIDLTKQALERARQEAKTALEASGKAETRKEAPLREAKIEDLPKVISQLEERLKATDEKRKAPREQMEEFQKGAQAQFPHATEAERQQFLEKSTEYRKLKEELESLDRERGLEVASIRDAQRQLESLKDSRKKDSDAVEEQKKNAKAAAAEVDALTRKLAELEERAKFATTAEHLTDVRKSGLRPDIGLTAMKGIEAEEARGHGEKLDKAQTQSVAQLAQYLQRSGMTQDQIVRILLMMQNQQSSFEAKLQMVAQLAAQAQQQSQYATRTDPGS